MRKFQIKNILYVIHFLYIIFVLRGWGEVIACIIEHNRDAIKETFENMLNT